MLKFILVIQLCYGATGVCFSPLTNADFIYDDYKSCILQGYEQGAKFISELDDQSMKSKPLIRFWCEEKVINEKEKINT